MKLRTLSVVCCVLLLRASALAQSAAATDPVSGNWGSDGSTRLELKFDGTSALSGTAIWRGGDGQERRTPIKTGTFNVKTGALKLEGEGMRPDGVTARYVIEGTVDGETMTGTFAFGDRTGTFTFTRQASPPANAGAAMRRWRTLPFTN